MCDRFGIPSSAIENDLPIIGLISGPQLSRNKRFNKGLAFTHYERQILHINGLLPDIVKSEEDQITHTQGQLKRYKEPIRKYLYLNSLRERNERLFFRVLNEDLCNLLPIVYTPTLGIACKLYSTLYKHSLQGLFITINDKGHIYDVLNNWPETDVRVIVVTDGAQVLSLGDLGANGMGISIGKCMLCTAFAGIAPHHCLPILLDVGSNTESVVSEPCYIGLKQPRVTGHLYDEFIDEFIVSVYRRFGQYCLVQFEDFSDANALPLWEKYKNTYCVYNGDIQGTGAIVLAGVLASLKITNSQLSDHTIMVYGINDISLYAAKLCVMYMTSTGTKLNEANNKVWLVDAKGLLVTSRPETFSKLAQPFIHEHIPLNTLLEAVAYLKPSILIGSTGIRDDITGDVLAEMSKHTDRPIIFATSTPSSNAECTPETVYNSTQVPLVLFF